MECCENDPHPGIKFHIFFPALSQSRTLVNLRNPTGRALLKAGAAQSRACHAAGLWSPGSCNPLTFIRVALGTFNFKLNPALTSH